MGEAPRIPESKEMIRTKYQTEKCQECMNPVYVGGIQGCRCDTCGSGHIPGPVLWKHLGPDPDIYCTYGAQAPLYHGTSVPAVGQVQTQGQAWYRMLQ